MACILFMPFRDFLDRGFLLRLSRKQFSGRRPPGIPLDTAFLIICFDCLAPEAAFPDPDFNPRLSLRFLTMRIPRDLSFSGVSSIIRSLFSLALLFAVSVPAAAEEPKFTYEDFKYSVCVGNGWYDKDMQAKILKYLTEENGGKAGKALHDDCAQDTMFSAMVRRSSSPDFLEKLLALGADPDYTGKTGYSARMAAVSLRRYQDVAPLFRGNIDFGRRNPAGDTLLMAAFSNEDPETARKLLEKHSGEDCPEGDSV